MNFNTPTTLATNPWTAGSAKKGHTNSGRSPEVLSLHVVPDSHSLVVITRAGDITTISLDEDEPTVREARVQAIVY